MWGLAPAGRARYIRLHVRTGGGPGRAQRRSAPGGHISVRSVAGAGRGGHRQDPDPGGPGGLAAQPGHAGQPDPAADVHPAGRGRHAGPGHPPRRERGRPGRRRHLPRGSASDHPGARRVVLAAAGVQRHRPARRHQPDGHPARRERPGHQPAAGATGRDLRGHLHPVREHRRPGARGDQGPVPVGGRLRDRARGTVPGLHRAQAPARPGRLRRSAAAVAGGAGRRGRGPGAARHVRRRPGG